MRILRVKVKKNKAAKVEIPITNKLKEIILLSKKDNIESPYIVHRIKSRSGKVAKNLSHPTQIRNGNISDEFTKIRDSLGLFSELSKKQRPTFHEIRSLAIYLYKKQGVDPQQRAAHSDAKTTEKYNEGHEKWNKIQAAELDI